ncbi:MAG: XdhC family protein [Longimicrobiales bacterium]
MKVERQGQVDRVTVVEAARAVMESLERGDDIAVVTVVDPPDAAGARLLITADGETRGTLGDAELDASARALALEAYASTEPFVRTVTVPIGRRMLYVEARRAAEMLLVVGAGHIAVPLARMGADLGFVVTVLDDREEFAAADRFAPGVRVLRTDFETDPFRVMTIGRRSYVALVTRGHKWDYDCLRQLLALPVQPRYIGMIGSRRRVLAAFRALLDAGVPRADLARVHAPIGLDLGAETPEEIAVSIAAELIQVRHDASALPLTSKERVLDRLMPENTGNEG